MLFHSHLLSYSSVSPQIQPEQVLDQAVHVCVCLCARTCVYLSTLIDVNVVLQLCLESNGATLFYHADVPTDQPGFMGCCSDCGRLVLTHQEKRTIGFLNLPLSSH